MKIEYRNENREQVELPADTRIKMWISDEEVFEIRIKDGVLVVHKDSFGNSTITIQPNVSNMIYLK